MSDDAQDTGAEEQIDEQTEPPPPPLFCSIDGAALLASVHAFLTRFIIADDDELRMVTLWSAATFLARELRTSPRLLIDSIVPESGKTTLLEHLERLCFKALLAAAITEALIPRMLSVEMRTLLLDEVQRTLRPDKPGVEELMSVINLGRRVGAKKPVLVQRGNNWEAVELPLFCPMAMAGNSPHLPQDTVDRSLRVLLMPDPDGTAEDSDWEGGLDEEAKELSEQLALWADSVRDHVGKAPGELPEGCISRFREKWRPLKRVAELAEFGTDGHEWKDKVDAMVVKDLEEAEEERRAGLRQQPPGLVLMCDLYRFWPPADDGKTPKEFVPTEDLIELLIKGNHAYWDVSINPPRSRLNATRLGRMIRQATKSTSSRPGGGGTPRGYHRSQFERVWKRLRVAELIDASADREGNADA